MMNMSNNEKLKKYYRELREVNAQIKEKKSDELINKRQRILSKIKREIRYGR